MGLLWLACSLRESVWTRASGNRHVESLGPATVEIRSDPGLFRYGINKFPFLLKVVVV